MSSTPDSDDVSPALLANAIGDHFRREYARSHDPASLDEAIAAYRDACEQGGTQSEYDRSVFLNNLAGVLGERFRIRDELADLEGAKTAYEAADGLTLDASVYKKMVKSNLGVCLQQLFNRTLEPSYVLLSAEYFHDALALCDAGTEEARMIAGSQVAVAERAFRASNNPMYLDWSIAAFDLASAELEGFKSPQKFLGQFAQLLIERFELHGRVDDLEAATQRIEQTLEYKMTASERVMLLAGLGRLCGTSLGRSYSHAVQVKQSAAIDEIVAMRCVDTREVIDTVMSLGVACQDQYTASGRIEQLMQAIRCFGALAGSVPPDDPIYGSLMANLGNALGDRYLRTRSRDDLERGLRCHRVAVDTLSGERRAAALTNLGTHLLHVFDVTDDVKYLHQAIQAYQASVDATEPASELLPARLDNLGVSLSERYVKIGDAADLDRSVALHERALALLAPPNEVRIGVLNNLALRLARRAESAVVGGDRERTWSLFRQACVEGLDVGLAEALKAARNWVNVAFELECWQQVVEAYSYFDEAATRLVRAQETRRDKEAWLRELIDVSERAAYAFARHGDCENAVMCLEHGTARLLSEALHASGRGGAQVSSVLPERISFDNVLVAARRAPIVYVCCTLAGSLALVVHRGGQVEPIWLTRLDVAELRRVLFAEGDEDGYLSVYLRFKNAAFDASATQKWQSALEHVAQWESEVVLQPLLDRLGSCDRIVLVAVGTLSMLPWQAGLLLQPLPGETHLLDRLQVTYAPNVSALRMGGDENERISAVGESLFAVVDPRPTSASPLPYAGLEVYACSAHFAHAVLLAHEDASWDAVLAGIAQASVFHFAGHAHADLRDPLRSGLTVAGDATLMLEDILSRSHRGRLAVLSACETSVAGLELPEESVSLSTGFLQFGFTGVIASQWSVADSSTFLLMTRFYKLWRRDPLDPAEALRQAQRWLRDATPAKLIAHLNKHRDGASDETSAALRARLRALPKASRPFSSPLHWAPFAYWGR